ncbi:MAG: tRNA (adenosine(37)-N6)-dimethylallyltransferase MiaA [Pseudomonadota bacterium]
MRPALLIHGPTASGKTALALALAKRLDGEVVNADSMQVYSDLRVLSARPSDEELAIAPHYLFGHVDAATRYSTGVWLDQARKTLADIERRGKTAVVVGGTGLYFMSLIQGLSDVPPVPEDVRADVRGVLQADGVDGLRARLAQVDPAAAERLGAGDRQRLARAYEVWLATGRTLASFHANAAPPVLGAGEWLGIALTPPRARLYSLIDRRFDGMLVEGAMEEAKALAARGLDPELPAMKAHGMPWLAAYLRGEMSAAAAAEQSKRDTRRYAKRQFTWIARQFPFWTRVPSISPDVRMKVVLALYREIDRA